MRWCWLACLLAVAPAFAQVPDDVVPAFLTAQINGKTTGKLATLWQRDGQWQAEAQQWKDLGLVLAPAEASKPLLAAADLGVEVRVDEVALTVDLAEETLLKGVFKADNAEGADLVKESLAGGVALMSLALPQINDQLGKQLPPEAKPALLVVEAIAKTTKFKVDGSTVIMTVARPKDFGK